MSAHRRAAHRHSHDCEFIADGVSVVDCEIFQWPSDGRLGLGTQTPPRDKRAVRLPDCRQAGAGLESD